MKSILILALLLTSLFSSEWIPYDKTKEASKKECKPIMLVVYQDNCNACVSFFKRIKMSNLVKSTLEDFIVSKITIEEALSKYGTRIESTPTIFVLDSKQQELLPAIKGLPSDQMEFVNYLQHASVVYEQTDCKND